MASLTLRVNGDVHRLDDLDPDTPLAYVLRNRLGLTGTRIGCGLEQCGACAVLVDGHSTLSCVAPAAHFQQRDITTVEGLSADPVGRRVQQAFVDAGAAQCGYCIAGIVISISAVLSTDPAPGAEALTRALTPHLCRCGAHPRILAAIRSLCSGETP